MQTERADFAPDAPDGSRRALLQGGLLVAGGMLVACSGKATGPTAGPAASAASGEAASPAAGPPGFNPATEFVFTIFATIADVLTVGETATGQVRAIPITGGEVVGENLKGRVVPGGADWQRTRSDGVTELEATYAIELSDRTVVKVVNRGIIVPSGSEAANYFRTAIEFVAPAGKWQWLNESIFLCTAGLVQDRPGTVQVDVFRLV
jgi:hypothetical protein